MQMISAEKKYHQITSLGFQNVYVYPGDYLNGYVYKIFMELNIFQLQNRYLIF